MKKRGERWTRVRKEKGTAAWVPSRERIVFFLLGGFCPTWTRKKVDRGRGKSRSTVKGEWSEWGLDSL